MDAKANREIWSVVKNRQIIGSFTLRSFAIAAAKKFIQADEEENGLRWIDVTTVENYGEWMRPPRDSDDHLEYLSVQLAELQGPLTMSGKADPIIFTISEA